jgi:hypothetical protein
MYSQFVLHKVCAKLPLNELADLALLPFIVKTINFKIT